MCGIAGFYIAPDDLLKINTQWMTAALGYEMKSRGTDATGIATVDQRGRWKVRKAAQPADVFLAGREGIGVNAQTALIHTRAATQGKASKSVNNHPIVYGDIVGIHNGIVWNDDQLFEHYKWPRNGEVDTEAIFAALNNLDQDDALTNIDGSWAIAWLDVGQDARQIWLARGSTSPLHYAVTEAGSVVFASTPGAVTSAFDYGGIEGKPTVIAAPEGFLAHTNLEGGLSVMETFDSSGSRAIGARTARQSYPTGWTGYSHGGMWDGEEAWYGASKKNTDDPMPGVRQWITGDRWNQKVGDRRKYLETNGNWVFEICTSTSPSLWAKISEAKVTTLQKAQIEARKEVVLPFQQDDLDDAFEAWGDEVRHGFAHTGDLICVSKSAIGGGEGSIVGLVTDEDEVSHDITVEWRPSRICRFADYEILISASKGG